MRDWVKGLMSRKVYMVALVLLVLGVSGYFMKSQLVNAGRGVAGPSYSEMSMDNNQTGAVPGSTTAPPETNGASGPKNSGSSVGDPEVISGASVAEKPSGAPASSQLSNAKHGWGMKRNSSHLQPEMPVSISAGLSKYGAYWIGSPNEKAVYLTFDNGYENGYTAGILDTLKANNVKAAFFITGHYLDTQPELVKRMVSEGHIVGNHTDTHPSLPDITDEQIKKELQTVERGFEKTTGVKTMKYLRPPKGEYSERTLAVTRELGYHNIFWSLALVDWVPMPGGPEEAYQSVMDNLHNGALILLHTVSKDDAMAMDRILKDMKAQGYTFKTLDDLVK
ncbi:MAG: Peptidoglycan-N-acetylmuramic acid deacetylase PdaA precursor [Pelotomaculum sp. PtaU1.Bin035]|nr:MAG: Peptidoglycan-N-acetylmuramic acid deacetylase PdaA precursor [Pelotomaculum sp. PtaU1.Bin035]